MAEAKNNKEKETKKKETSKKTEPSKKKKVTPKKKENVEKKEVKKTTKPKTVKKQPEIVEIKKEELPKEIEKKVTNEQEEKSDKKKLLLLLLLLLFLIVFGISVTFGKEIYLAISDQIIEVLDLNKLTAPKITGGSKEWKKESIIRVEKDSQSKVGIAYYEYCIREEESTKNCNWAKTETKNVKVTKTGIYYVTFRGVDKEERISKNSNTEVVYIDNSSAVIKDVKIKEKTSNSIKVEVEAIDKHSGIKSYSYSLDGKKYVEGKESYTYTGLENNKEYTIYIKLIDKVGNETVLSMVVKTEEGKQEETCTLNCDTNNDGICDLNCDTDGDGLCDKNCDDNGDGICDRNCDETVEDNETETPGENNPENPDENNPETPGDGEENEKPEVTPTPTPGDGEDSKEDNDEDEKIEIPEINLDKVPTEFVYGSKYELPSYVNFGNDTGTYECIVEGKEYKDTSTLSIGKHLIVCNATNSKNVRVMVEKLVNVVIEEGEEEIWHGWIKLNLYYPENSTNWEYRIGLEGEIRTGYENTDWQAYTGPILVKLEDVDDVYIRYELNGETYIVAPSGKVAVDIEPVNYTLNEGETTDINIYYDKDAKTKEYKIDNGSWQEYSGTFTVGVNQTVEARALKEEKVYDSEGNYVYTSKRTGTDSVFIGEYVEDVTSSGGTTSGGIKFETITTVGGQVVTSPVLGSKPSTYLAGPVISSSPQTELVESVKVKVRPQEVAEKIYISIGNGKYEEYTDEIEVKINTLIKAYYVRYSDGKVSDTSYYYIQNIKTGNKPYVRIDVTPNNYLSETQKEATVKISGSNYDKLEYSLDGETYKPYTNELTITESITVYARGTNSYGSKVERVVIATTTAPVVKETLTVHIELNPNKDEIEGLANKTEVSIYYDSKAEKKYYKLSSDSEWIEYTGPFEVDRNTTVYGYCTSESGSGKTSKRIDFLTTGISEPIINTSPTTSTQQVKIEIEYDKNATVTRYQIGNGAILEYNGPFYVYENTTITAYNKNVLGYEAESTYEVKNITETPKYSYLDMGMYYIIKLNYPKESIETAREYKWKPDGKWKAYNSKGILLIKPEYKDELDKDSDGIRVKDENGKEVIFTDHYYVIDVPFSELSENIFMRWDNSKIKAPQIIVTPTGEATKEVEVGIVYSNSIVKKQYKIVKEDGTDSGWLEYTGAFKVKENNVIIYAKGLGINNNDSEIASKKVTNIDLIAPEITVTGEFTKPKRQVTVKVNAKDNMMMSMVMWTKGEKTKEYFKENGTSMKNGGTFKVTENGKYTIYAVDQVGNEIIEVIEVTNIDLNAPNIIIDVLTEKYGTEAEVSIDYGDSQIKEYRIGETTTTYKTYEENIIISAYDVFNLVNEDGTLTIYARGTDQAGNVTEVSEKIYVLDLDKPTEPIIHSTAGYPVLTEYGVVLGQDNYIIFDQTRSDITNYYSMDNGTTWKVYTGPFELESGTIIAKSVKNESGLTVTSTKKVEMPTDALSIEAYDGKKETNSLNKGYIMVDNSMYGKNARLYTYTDRYGWDIYFYDKNNNELQKIGGTYGTTGGGYRYADVSAPIPMGTEKIYFSTNFIYEVGPDNKPIITETKYYPKLTEYTVEQAYSDITIDYFSTSIQRLYRINNGEWQVYQDTPIRLQLNDVIEAKGIDKYNVETEITELKITLVDDGLSPEAYDEDKATNALGAGYIAVDDSMQGKNVRLYTYTDRYGWNIYFYDKNNEELQKIGATYGTTGGGYRYADVSAPIPVGTEKIYFSSNLIYEVEPYNKVIITETKYYPKLTEYKVEQGYSDVMLSYFSTSVQRLYRINNGNWQDYQDTPIRLEIDDVIEAKGIDKYNAETEITTLKIALLEDALSPEAYDEDKETKALSKGYIAVDNNMQGKNARLYTYTERYGWSIYFYDKNNEELQKIGATYGTSGGGYRYADVSAPIPIGTDKIYFSSNLIYEISPDNKAVILQKQTYPNLTSTSFEQEKYEIKITYLSYLTNRQYSLDNGTTWQEYKGPFNANIGDVIKAKAVDKDGTETEISTYTVTAISDSLAKEAFDNNKETKVTIAKNTTKTFTLSEDTIGKDIRFFFSGTNSSTATIKVFDKENNELENISIIDLVTVFKVPENAYKVTVTSGTATLTVTEINIRPEVTIKNNNPIIEINSTDWTTSKTIDITYPEGYRNEYSLDFGTTWQEYLSPVTVENETVIIARVMDNDKVISSSSMKITKVDSVEPEITLNMDDEIVTGSNYNLPTSYKLGPSGGIVNCFIGEEKVTTTKELVSGTYTIECSVTNNLGISKTISKVLKVSDSIALNSSHTLKVGDEIVAIDGSKWHVLEASEAGSKTVVLLSDHNLNSDGTYNTECGYEIDGTYKCSVMPFDPDNDRSYNEEDSNNIGYFIKYTYAPLVTEVLPGTDNVTIPTGEQIATADGKVFDNSKSPVLTSTWLKTTNYWTQSNHKTTAYRFYGTLSGTLNHHTAATDNIRGARPVITTIKTNLIKVGETNG